MAQTWINAALMLPTSALLAAAVLGFQAPDLSHVQTQRTTKGGAISDLPSAIEQTALKQSAALELSEGDLNAHLAQHLRSSQSGATQRLGKLDQVLIDLEDNHATIHLCWRVFGHRIVASADLTLRRTEQDFQIARRFSAGRVFQRFTGCFSGRSRSQKPPHSSLSWTGEMRSDLPRRSTFTSRVSSLSAFGTRIAWLPPDQKTFARTVPDISSVYTRRI